MNGSDPKLSARELLEEAHPALVGLSHWIHANPEIGYQETMASGWVAEWLVTGGFDVETGVAGMPTAVIGRTGPGPFHVAICVEYDALPEVGHACGHNVIAAASVGAGLALASVAEELGLRVTVLGTPAEETGGGKLRLIDAGAFDGVHAAMMVHPWPTDVATPDIIAVNQLEVSYTGREAHAAGFPQRGLNAADALVVAQTAIGLLRQQLLPTDRVHGIVTRGGDAPNIIPAHTTALYMVRAHDRARMDELTGLVTRCFEAGALATGTSVSVVEGTAYADMVHDPDLAALYRHNAELLGRVFDDSTGSPVSTDMGNVSHIVPSIHPMIGIASNGAVNHQAAFADACATPSADQAVLDGAIAMTWTVIDAAQDEVLRGRLIADALAREAIALAEQAEELEENATILARTAEAFAPEDPETGEKLALAAVVPDAEAEELQAEGAELAVAADQLSAAAIADLSSSAVSAMGAASELADDAAILSQVEPESLQPAADVLAEGEVLVVDATTLEDEATTFATGAAASKAASDAALDDVADDATVAVGATEEAADLQATADALADEAVELSGEFAVLSAEVDALTERYADVVPADRDTAELLAATAFELESRAQDIADQADATFEQALEIEVDAEAAQDLAEVAIEAAEDAETEAEAQAVLAAALASRALRADDLAEVVQEASEDGAVEAGNDALIASVFAHEDALRTGDLPGVDQAAVEDAAAGSLDDPSATVPNAAVSDVHADWEQQFQAIAPHATWADEYTRTPDGGGAGGEAAVATEPEPEAVEPHGEADAWAAAESEASVVRATDPDDVEPGTHEPEDAQPWRVDTPAEDAWYSGAPVLDVPEAAADGPGPSADETPETPLGDFEWIPAAPAKES